MALITNRTTRNGKLVLILLAILGLVIAGGSLFGGIFAVLHMSHWAKYIICVAACLFALIIGALSLFMIVLSFSLINSWKSVRDTTIKGTANVRLCDMCGRVITKNAEYCEHCGAKQETGNGLKTCPNCKTKNSGNANFCEHCGFEFKTNKKKEQ